MVRGAGDRTTARRDDMGIERVFVFVDWPHIPWSFDFQWSRRAPVWGWIDVVRFYDGRLGDRPGCEFRPAKNVEWRITIFSRAGLAFTREFAGGHDLPVSALARSERSSLCRDDAGPGFLFRAARHHGPLEKMGRGIFPRTGCRDTDSWVEEHQCRGRNDSWDICVSSDSGAPISAVSKAAGKAIARSERSGKGEPEDGAVEDGQGNAKKKNGDGRRAGDDIS